MHCTFLDEKYSAKKKFSFEALASISSVALALNTKYIQIKCLVYDYMHFKSSNLDEAFNDSKN